MYEERPPDPALAGRVTCVWQQMSELPSTQLVVPDGCVDLIWGPEGLFVAGPDTGPMPTPMLAGDTFTGIRFGPGASGDVFGVPVHAMLDQRVPLASLGALTELAAAPIVRPIDRPADRLAAMRAAVVSRLRETPPPDPAAPAIAAALRSGQAVREAAWQLGFSERQLRRRSIASFGYAPKVLQRIVRFQRALRLARSGVPLADVAAATGYADQSHLSHDVRRLSGVSLRALV